MSQPPTLQSGAVDALTSGAPGDLRFLEGGGELTRLITAFDWSRTPLGAISTWPDVLRTTLALILRSPVPIVTLWGESGVMLYNDAYAVFAGARHPGILGLNVLDAWPEAADWNRNIMDRVFHAGETFSVEDQQLTLYRHGTGEPVWMNLDYSQIVDSSGAVAGVIAIVVETTGKVRAQQHISGERERLRRMFDEAPGFMTFLEGPEFLVTMANRAYFDLVGGRELIGKTIREALPEVEDQGFVQLLGDVYRTGEPFTGWATPVILSRAGIEEERFVDFIYQPVADDDGAISGIFVQGHDVTDQHLAIAALKESEERFRLVAERAPVMLWMSDAVGHCAYLNKAQREFWGLSDSDVSGFDWGRTVHPADDPKLAHEYAQAMAVHAPFTIEARYRRHDGVYRRFHTHAEPRINADGQFMGMIGVNVDITDVREAEERYRRIFEQASDLILTADLNQIITDCNPAAAEAVGLTRAECIGRGISEFMSSDDFVRSSGMLQAKLERGGTTQYDVRVRSSSGDWLQWEVNSGLTFDDGGNPVGLHVVARDVTERKRFERHQQLLVGELNHRVKNTLAIVQSLAHQSFSVSVPPKEAIGRFEGRLEALAAAHNLLTRRNWEDASISDVVSSALGAFCSEGRLRAEGPRVQLPPQTAVSLSLALHELATNAAKYGALSVDSGSVAVDWSVDGDQLVFTWRELGGPPVSAPTHRGFGTRMIERTLAAEFGGSVDLTFDPAGLACRVVAPLPTTTD